MNKESIYEIVADKLGVDMVLVKDEADLREDLGADSLDIIEAVMELEKEFNITIEDSIYDRVNTVGDIVEIIKEKTND